MSKPEQVDTLILGSGQGGKLLAWHLGRSGQKVAVVERQWVGGSCPAVACLPSKNEIWSARVAHLAHHAAAFGTTTGAVKTDLAKVRQRKREMVERETAAHLHFYQSTGGELVMGTGRFVAPKTIEVALNDGGTRTLTGAQVVVNVGSHAAIPEIAGLKDARPLTHIEALELGELPEHLIVLGGGYIGIEMAQALRRFGSRVTIIDHNPHLMHREDPDIADEVQNILRSEGIELLLGAQALNVAGQSGKDVRVTVRVADNEKIVDGSHLLVATGRIPNTADIGLDKTGVELDERGYLRVNERLQTSAPGVWAIGECAGSPHFTHVSVDDFRIVRDNMAGGTRSTQDRLVPYCMFTDPPLAHVGLNESEAKRRQVPVRVARLPMKNVLRGEATDETLGFMKVLVGADDDRIVGFTMLGAESGEVMAAVQTAMLADLPYTKLRDAVIAHLTYAEGLGPLLGNVPARAG
ncbi:FAD-dependent oxidoreductase [Paraburkholderia rhizosphaerae]|uniref:Pyruvate/2-oxoglutarate dehydrogenase complex dihydrolipoamide dehydrogenase (E3) component n=1 Tax=Paraburkholderia rhizosphaerae TaxID=480658 RepID=A0A4R8LH09_9BURK|nr:FAD-dependent oxidoreductase [Paraburkholderia rhizosphaerae]TDY42447.1 pyruvate/2-oxoglutarate dehydrogenase complex dihydrolipoamide dehydrogenase (E3) component [Paraburkholderia rhizosphaerae]